MNDDSIMRALVAQVSAAVPRKSGGSEQDVTTLITRPMWEAFLRAVGEPPGTEPSPEWSKTAVRVYGSCTVVFEAEHMASISFSMENYYSQAAEVL